MQYAISFMLIFLRPCMRVTAWQVLKYPDYTLVNLDILDHCATTNNLKEINDCPNYFFVKGSITNLDLVCIVELSTILESR
jgi:dTDP-D-glucose 4,6-dehydratase